MRFALKKINPRWSDIVKVVVVVAFIVGCSGKSSITATSVAISVPEQTYFDRRTFDSFIIGKTSCDQIRRRLSQPEIQITIGDYTRMVYTFEIPLMLFEHEQITSDVITIKTVAKPDYSQYRKMIFEFDKDCILKKRQYDATLSG